MIQVYKPHAEPVNLALRELDGQVFFDAVVSRGRLLYTVFHITPKGILRRHKVKDPNVATDTKGRIRIGSDYR